MAGNEVSLFDIICRLNRFVSESQVGNGYAAGFLGVVLEVSLCFFICVVTDDLNRVLVCTNRTVCTKSPEFTSLCSLRSNIRIVRDPWMERCVTSSLIERVNSFFGSAAPEVFVNSKNITRLYVLGTKTVTTACRSKQFSNSVPLTVQQPYLSNKGSPSTAGFFGSIKNSDLLNRLRHNVEADICWTMVCTDVLR